MLKVMKWAQRILKKHHISIFQYKIFRHVPWSIVYQIMTDHGLYYLKVSHPIYSDEWKILNYFQQHHYHHTPVMIAYDEQMNSVLLKDGGENLHQIFQEHYIHKLMLKALDQYADIQVKSSQHINELNHLMAMNWDLKKFSISFQDFLRHEREILIQDGVNEKMLIVLEDFIPSIEKSCYWIESFRIPASIEHGDLFDENFLFRKGHLMISDWADTGVGHPFFSFGFFIERLQENYSIRLSQYLSLKYCYLSHWRHYASAHELNRMLISINHLSKLRTVMSYARIAKLTKNHDMDIYKGYLQKNLMTFIHQFSKVS